MKRFNKSIHISVAVDYVADLLRKQMKDDFKHKDIVVEAIIGSGIHNPHAMGLLLGALNGWSNELDFKVGEVVMCTAISKRKAVQVDTTEGTKPTLELERVPIGDCVVVEVDPYKPSSQIQVEFEEDFLKNGDEIVRRKALYWAEIGEIKSLKDTKEATAHAVLSDVE